MKITAGRYTLALTMIACGVYLIINNLYRYSLLLPSNLLVLVALVFVAFGIEVILLNLIFGSREGYRVHISIGSLLLSILIIILFAGWMGEIRLPLPFFDIRIDL